MTTVNHATVGCAFESDDALVAAVLELARNGDVSGWRIGATDASRAARLAAASGAVADLDPLDPLSGVAGVVTGDDAAERVNRGAVIGGAVGAVLGMALALLTTFNVIPVDAAARPVAATLLTCVIGVACGGVLGGAIGKRSSTHAGFRIIDAMEAGHAAAVGDVAAGRVDDVRGALERAGASEVIVIAV